MITHYKVFSTVAEQKSFLKASEILNLTPSAISHSISKMECEFGFKLFIRKKGGVQLTNHAKEIYPYITQILNDENKLYQIVSQLNGLEKGAISIGTFNSVFINWMPTIFKSFKKVYPNIDIKVYQGGYDDVVKWIKDGVVDISFVSLSNCDDLDVTPIYKDKLMCLTPKNFVKSNKKYFTIDDIRKHKEKIIYQKEGYDAETNNFLKKYDISCASHFTIENDLSLMAMVESGFGICIVPELVTTNQKFNIDYYPIQPSEYRVIAIASLEKRTIPPLALKFHDFIIEYLEKSGIKNI